MSSTDTDDDNVDNYKLPRKRAKRHLTVGEKENIVSIYETELQESSTLLIGTVVNIVATKTGVCTSTVYNTIKEYKKNKKLSASKINLNRRCTVDLVDDFDRNVIRKKIHQFYFKYDFPTRDKVLEVVNQDNDLPNFKKTTFYKFLKSLNFKEHCGKGGMLVDREEIVLWRRDYLKKIRSYRNENRKIYYLDETWINTDLRFSEILDDAAAASSKEIFLTDFAAGVKNHSGDGTRLIICHIGSDDGFVPDALWTFESKRSLGCHEDIDWFEKWFLKVLPKLEENAVIVLDSAPYHSRKIEERPTCTCSKTDIESWLSSKNIQFEPDMVKTELLAIVNKHKEPYNKYIVDELARQFNKITLRIPPYHSELNPIEMIWAEIKNYVASKNTTLEFANVKNLFYEAVGTIGQATWQTCIQHVQQKIEEDMWELDEIIERNIEPLAIKSENEATIKSESGLTIKSENEVTVKSEIGLIIKSENESSSDFL